MTLIENVQQAIDAAGIPRFTIPGSPQGAKSCYVAYEGRDPSSGNTASPTVITVSCYIAIAGDQNPESTLSVFAPQVADAVYPARGVSSVEISRPNDDPAEGYIAANVVVRGFG